MPICHVPVLASGAFSGMEDVLKYLGDSLYITDAHIEHLREDAERLGRPIVPNRITKTIDELFL